MLSNRNCFKLLVKMISASPIAGCPSFKFLTMQMQPSASCARMWTVLSATIMFADKPHRLNERTSAQRFCVLTILPPVPHSRLGYPRSGLSRSDFVLWHKSEVPRCPLYFRSLKISGSDADSSIRSKMPSRPREFHPEPLTDPDLILSHHPARAID
jgi:hypothetical protein